MEAKTLDDLAHKLNKLYRESAKLEAEGEDQCEALKQLAPGFDLLRLPTFGGQHEDAIVPGHEDAVKEPAVSWDNERLLIQVSESGIYGDGVVWKIVPRENTNRMTASDALIEISEMEPDKLVSGLNSSVTRCQVWWKSHRRAIVTTVAIQEASDFSVNVAFRDIPSELAVELIRVFADARPDECDGPLEGD